mmetsp:Transcript_31742/g.75373  ORF Transcript_31742/g.75373 Transcript_31742/m.75373 type:complete len:257 (-) Transcript_31742:1107-1877(-)
MPHSFSPLADPPNPSVLAAEHDVLHEVSGTDVPAHPRRRLYVVAWAVQGGRPMQHRVPVAADQLREPAPVGDLLQDLNLQVGAARDHVLEPLRGHDLRELLRAGDELEAHALELAGVVLLGEGEGRRDAPLIHGLAEALLADRPQPGESKLVGRHEQVLCHVHVQVGALVLLREGVRIHKVEERLEDRRADVHDVHLALLVLFHAPRQERPEHRAPRAKDDPVRAENLALHLEDDVGGLALLEEHREVLPEGRRRD